MENRYLQILKAGKLALTAGLVALTTGCGTINSGKQQTIRIETDPSNATIKLQDYSGCRIVGVTPVNYQLNRGHRTSLIIEKEGYNSKFLKFEREFNDESFKNFYLGPFFFIGGFVDLCSGGAWVQKPEKVNLILDKIVQPQSQPPVQIIETETPLNPDEKTIRYLKLLKELKDSDTINEEEFNQKRKSLVDKL